ncbi:MAG: T9SS type A sorting domain-containing protein [Bacteroidales bacterium]|nr:T9SS type A sorting domain-containing protein [Bacteroidales bacterium]
MKKILTILIAVLSLQGYSQEWAEVGSIWHYTKATINPDVTSYTTFESVSDTIISGVPCKHVVQVDRAYDTTSVFSHFMYSSNDSVFFFRDGDFHLLLYFGAVAGDTIVLGWYGTASGDPLVMIVDSTSTIDINGETRTLQYVDCGDGLVVEYADEVIEGIGSTYFMFPVADGEPYGSLRCYEDSTLGLFLSPFHPNHGWNFEECDEIITRIDERIIDQSLNTFPNPFTTTTTIEYELYTISSIQFTVYNMMGEVVFYSQENMLPPGRHTLTWSPGHLPAGLYYGVLRSGDGVTVVKLIKQ